MKNQMQKHRKANSQTRIRTQAALLAGRYVRMIEDGITPPLLSYMVERERNSLLREVSDARLNQSDTVHTIQILARTFIKNHLAANPEINRTFGRMRREESLKRESEELREHQLNHATPFPITK